MIKLTIPGQPIPLARPRFYGGRAIDSQASQKNGVKTLIRSQLSKLGVTNSAGMPINGAETPCNCKISADLTFHIAMPKNLSRARKKAILDNPSHNCKPDLDNLIKFILDCGNRLLWPDDCAISEIAARKIWAEIPKTEIAFSYLIS